MALYKPHSQCILSNINVLHCHMGPSPFDRREFMLPAVEHACAIKLEQ